MNPTRPEGPSFAFTRLRALTGAIILAVIALITLTEWGVEAGITRIVPWAVAVLIALFALQVRPGRNIFVLVGLVLTVALAVFDPDWYGVMRDALLTAGFIAAFFSAQATLRTAAETSPAIRRAGQFLSQQPPGRRYIALSLGTQAFGFLLNYGAIVLLGGLVTSASDDNQNRDLAQIRRRRMLLAIQRGFISTLPISPLSFAVVMTVALVPGATPVDAIMPGLVTAALMVGVGWSMDSLFKPRIAMSATHPAPPLQGWQSMLPLLFLLLGMLVSLLVLHGLTGVRFSGLVLTLVPLLAGGWIWLQLRGRRGGFGHRIGKILFFELPGYSNEIVLLMMAGYIGTVGGTLSVPVIAAAGLDLTEVPTAILLVALVWIVPLAGQIGMNPILVITLVAPLLPPPEVLGVSTSAVVVALTSGWVLSGITSPFTATTLLIGLFGKVTAREVGIGWNGAYALAMALSLSAWVLLLSM